MTASGDVGPTGNPDVFFGQPIIPFAIVTISLSTIFVGLRCWSRAVIFRVFALEDWFLLLGWICAITVSAGNIAQLHSGLGRMYASLTPAVFTEYLKLALSINIVYAIALASVKISILSLYIRALKYDYVPLIAKVVLAIVVVTHLWIIASLFTVCVPLDAFWDHSKYKTSYCHPFAVWWSHSGINISTDIIIFALPLTVLRKLRVPPRQKIALVFVFLLAFCVCIISLVRTLLFIHGMTPADRGTVVIACWTMAEVNIAVVCACLTTIKPVLAKVFPRLLSSRQPTRTDEEGGIETIGHACRTPHDLLNNTTAVSGAEKESERSITATESLGMEDIENRNSRGSVDVDDERGTVGKDLRLSITRSPSGQVGGGNSE